MNNISMLQTDSKRDRKEYNQQLDPIDLINRLANTGYNPVGNYQEQVYYNKTIEKNTDKHGQYCYSLLSEQDRLIGLSVVGSRDCQLPLALYIGLRLGDQVIPVLSVKRVKHNKNNSLPDSEDICKQVTENIKEFKSNLQAWLNDCAVSNLKVLQYFDQVNEYRSNLMNCGTIQYPASLPTNKLELFSLLVNSFVMGKSVNVSGKKARKIKHLRDILHLTSFIYQLISK
jgi:hypothetical protein